MPSAELPPSNPAQTQRAGGRDSMRDTSGDRPSIPVEKRRTYTVYCSYFIGDRRATRDIVRGLSWSEATKLAATLLDREHHRRVRKFGYYSSWRARIFLRRLE